MIFTLRIESFSYWQCVSKIWSTLWYQGWESYSGNCSQTLSDAIIDFFACKKSQEHENLNFPPIHNLTTHTNVLSQVQLLSAGQNWRS